MHRYKHQMSFKPPVANALMWYLVVERVGPQWRVGDRRSYAGIVDKPELAHHQELPGLDARGSPWGEPPVPASAEEGHPQTPDVLHVHSSEPAVKVVAKWTNQLISKRMLEPVDDVCLSNHLIKPVFNSGILAPPGH